MYLFSLKFIFAKFLFYFSATKGDFGSEVERLSVNYAEHSYTIVSTNQKINVIKRNTAEIYE